MDINKNLIQNYDLNDEAGYIDEADEDFVRYGNSDLPCPRCGSKLIYENYGSAHIIRCEKDNCLKVTYRGL
ncbi:hypothetical protein SAMN02745136_04654 [Anaerocolumna jejuensis DSM 15929]|uniref:Uncharacterized protein n=1 Tax=Anaerocolumna jejuensis DSM 15929 TaxID=1121322 RepID=A0A1M6ZSZ2_9FIRM|nr:hypothetical protein [Anaerocolumna jejuensis]SHL33546.1 hypothetical protein SAMN02745136_04654 [Anaerocolumna jejuensis DSM 15929]